MSIIEFYSHIYETGEPDKVRRKTVEQHLWEVLEHGNRSVSQLPPRFSQNADFRTLVTLSCLCHDFGKLTTYFQRHLLGNHRKQDSKSNHGFISALFTAFQVDNASLTISPQVNPYLALISYLCVLHHHGDLGNLHRDVIQGRKLDTAYQNQLDPHHRTNVRNAEAQIPDIQNHVAEIEDLYGSVYPSYDFQIDKFAASWMDFLRAMDKVRYTFENREQLENKMQVYIHLLLLYSILIDADKKSAAEVDVPQQRRHLLPSLVDDHREASPEIDTTSQEGINGIRNEIYSKVNSSIIAGMNDLDTHHIMTLTSPTGTGKTLSALSAALKLRARIQQEKCFTPRIIYSLPFTSIIDQNFDVVEDVLSLLKDYQDNQQEYLLKHHYLSNIEFKSEGQEMEPDDAILMIESWESEMIVTTFVQLLQTIIGFRNKYLKKYHKIAGSIIILDEVQNIPVEYWQLVSDSLRLVCRMLDCYVILLTATKPLLFDESECIELVRDNLEYFRHFRRTRLNTNMDGISLEEMAQKFIELYDEEESLLVVANTIKSSLYLYRKIEEFINAGVTHASLYYLSSNVIPRVRGRRIKEISETLSSGEKPILVSTQVVEAGVNLDFDKVVRDLGPIDSVVQVAGRCNRAGKNPRSDVYVYNITDDRGRSLSTYVYGPSSTIAARDALANGIYNEEIYHELVNEFFRNVKEIKSQQKSRDIWNAAVNLCFHSDNRKGVSNFSLIESLPNMVDVFVQVDDDAVTLWEDYQEGVLHERDMRKKRLKFMDIKADFHSYIISVPLALARELIQVSKTGNFYLLPYSALDRYYSHTTGFKRMPEEASWIL